MEYSKSLKNRLLEMQNDSNQGLFTADKDFRNLVNAIKELTEFSNKANLKLFDNLFGESVGDHLWSLFITEYNKNMLRFLCRLDKKNQFLLYLAIHKKKEVYLYSYC